MSVRQKLRQAMSDPDNWVIRCEYRDRRGFTTSRVISPIRFIGGDRVAALCLGREAPRQFLLSQIRAVELVPASDVQMPEPIEEIETK